MTLQTDRRKELRTTKPRPWRVYHSKVRPEWSVTPVIDEDETGGADSSGGSKQDDASESKLGKMGVYS